MTELNSLRTETELMQEIKLLQEQLDGLSKAVRQLQETEMQRLRGELENK